MPNSLIDYSKMSIADIAKLDGTPWALADHQLAELTRIATVEKPKRPSKRKGVPNGLETAFARDCAVPCFYEAVKFSLAGECTYTPDYLLAVSGRPATLVEIKGPREWEDSRIKLKVAAAKFPHWDWYLVKRGSQGQWQVFPVDSSGIKRKPVDVDWLSNERT